MHRPAMFFFFFFNDTATTEIYTLSLHDALPISSRHGEQAVEPLREHRFFPLSKVDRRRDLGKRAREGKSRLRPRSEEHTSELQSRQYLVCRLLLEKKKTASKPRCGQ